MDKDELTRWALSNGWRMFAEHPCLTKPIAPSEPIVRLVFLETVAVLEVRKPAGKWEKVASEAYPRILPDEDDGPPSGLGFEKLPSITRLMRDNKDQLVFAKMGGSPKPRR